MWHSVDFIYDQYEHQVRGYVTRNGIHQNDLQSFYQFCRENPRQFTEVLQQQMYQHDMRGWRGMINRFQSNYAPSLGVLQANGFETRTSGSEPEERVGGIWMSVKGAAKAGLI